MTSMVARIFSAMNGKSDDGFEVMQASSHSSFHQSHGDKHCKGETVGLWHLSRHDLRSAINEFDKSVAMVYDFEVRGPAVRA